MDRIQLRQTFFRVDPIKNIVGMGDKVAYYISVTRGATLGVLGRLPDPVRLPAGNDPLFEAAAGGRGSWLRRIMSALVAPRAGR